jgi:hypothetical protein
MKMQGELNQLKLLEQVVKLWAQHEMWVELHPLHSSTVAICKTTHSKLIIKVLNQKLPLCTWASWFVMQEEQT